MVTKRRPQTKPLADWAFKILDPLVRRRSGINMALLENWDAIVGQELAKGTRPLRAIWPHKNYNDDRYEPATLVVAADGFAAMRLQHQCDDVIRSINVFFGYSAINRIKIEQKSFERKPISKAHKKLPALPEHHRHALVKQCDHIEIEDLKQALIQLGENILAENYYKDRKKP